MLICFSEKEELRVAIYAYGEDCYLISATTSITESGTPTKMPYATSDQELGHAVLDQFLQCDAHDEDTTDASLVS